MQFELQRFYAVFEVKPPELARMHTLETSDVRDFLRERENSYMASASGVMCVTVCVWGGGHRERVCVCVCVCKSERGWGWRETCYTILLKRDRQTKASV